MITEEPSSMSTPGDKKYLLMAIGNSGRQDDGLGWAFAERAADFFPGRIEYRYQLQIEDADLIHAFEKVYFVDAYRGGGKKAFVIEPCRPEGKVGFSTHALPPEAVLYLCRELYGNAPQAWLISIKGYQWELAEGLSRAAWKNLARALKKLSGSDFRIGP